MVFTQGLLAHLRSLAAGGGVGAISLTLSHSLRSGRGRMKNPVRRDATMPIGFTRSHAEILADKDLSTRAVATAMKGRIEDAIELARGIIEDWYRCQAFSRIAEHAKDRTTQLDLIDEALRAARLTEEPNRIVTVSSWPVEVLATLGETETVRAEVVKLLKIAESEPHPVRRADGIFKLWCHLHSGNAADDILHTVLKALWAASSAGHGWKRDRNLRDVAVLLARMGWKEQADHTVTLIEQPRVKRQAERGMRAPTDR